MDFINKALAQVAGVPQGGSGINLQNPLGAGSIPALLDKIADYLIYIGAPILAIMILWGGFQILTAAGEPEKFKTGRTTIIYAAVGYGIILISKGITLIIKELFGA